jgi:sulfite exporter TauE/SafE
MHHLMAVAGPISLFAAFAAGAAGSVHCVAMCGGMSGALGMRARRHGANSGQAFVHGLTYQAGRIGSYSFAGALVGAFGGLLQANFDVDKAALAARSLAGLVLILAAVGVLSKWRPLSRLEVLGARIWKHLAPAARAIPVGGLRSSLLLGMLWGWLPCGLVYSMLLVAALAGGPLMGAATMLSFGVGTAPAVLATGLLGGQVWRVAEARRLNLAAGSILLIFGLLTMLAPLSGHAYH